MANIELLYQEAIRMRLDKRYEFKSRLADLYVQQISEKARAEITDVEIKNFFEKNRAAYEQVSAKHILLKFKPGLSAKEKSGLKTRLEEIRQNALKNPSLFAELAKTHSEDGSKDNGGELGFFSREMMVAPFSKAAFALKQVGEISPIVESQFGFHIIQLTGDRRGFDEYKEAIKDQMLRTSQRTRLDAELQRLKKLSAVEIFEDNLSKLSPLPAAVTEDPEKLVPEKTEAPAGESTKAK